MVSDIEISVDGMRISGSGVSNSYAIAEYEENPRFRYTEAYSRSEQEFRFTIDQEMYFLLSGALGFDELVGSTNGGVAFSLRDYNSSTSDFNLSMGDSYVYEDFSHDFLFGGLLPAGTYFFEIYAFTDAYVYSSYSSEEEGASASYAFDFVLGETYPFQPSVVETPVPAAGWLFGSALIGLLGLRRRKVCQS